MMRINHRLVVIPTPTRTVIANATHNSPPEIKRRGPMCLYRHPAICDEIITPIACGNVVRPGCNAESPRRFCR